MESWANGELQCETKYQTEVQEARFLGRLELARELIELDISQLNQDKE